MPVNQQHMDRIIQRAHGQTSEQKVENKNSGAGTEFWWAGNEDNQKSIADHSEYHNCNHDSEPNAEGTPVDCGCSDILR